MTNRLRFPEGLPQSAYRETTDYDRAQASTFPASLRFEVGALEVASDRLTLPGVLTNDSPSEVELVVVLGVFTLDFADGAFVQRRPWPGPPRPPPVPPPPMLLLVPASSCVEMHAHLYLPDWIYEGAPTVRLVWSLTSWNEPRPQGELEATLFERGSFEGAERS